MNLTSEQKKALKKEYLQKQKAKYILKKVEVKKLFNYIDNHIQKGGCDHTLNHTTQWLRKNINDESRREKVIEEITDMGGLCDCEVILNCYERYELF